MKLAGLPIPKPVLGRFLIDTGASCTVVDTALIAPLNLPPTGSVAMHTPSTAGSAHTCNQYDVMLFMSSGTAPGSGHIVDALPVIEADLKSQGIDGLIGRDVLASCVLVFNGTANTVSLGY